MKISKIYLGDSHSIPSNFDKYDSFVDRDCQIAAEVEKEHLFMLKILWIIDQHVCICFLPNQHEKKVLFIPFREKSISSRRFNFVASSVDLSSPKIDSIENLWVTFDRLRSLHCSFFIFDANLSISIDSILSSHFFLALSLNNHLIHSRTVYEVFMISHHSERYFFFLTTLSPNNHLFLLHDARPILTNVLNGRRRRDVYWGFGLKLAVKLIIFF